MEKETFKVVHLRQAELDYELAIRGVKTSRTVAEKRKVLSGFLVREIKFPGSTIRLEGYDSTFDQERDAISATLDTIATSIGEFEGNTSDSQFKVIKSRLCHVAGRIHRLVVPDGDDDAREFKNESYASCFQYETELVEKASRDSDVKLESVVNEGPVINLPAPLVTYVTKSSPVSDWPVRFSGDSSKVFSFLETVTELARSRKVSNEDLFSSAVELFTGDAFVWYRSVRNEVNDWNTLVARIKTDFLSPYCDDDIWDQIKARKQRKNETALIFIAQLENLFTRLSRPPAEETKVKNIRRNLLPEYIGQLALEEIYSVSKLSALCKKLEEAKHIKNKNIACINISKIDTDNSDTSSRPEYFRNKNFSQKKGPQNFNRKSNKNANRYFSKTRNINDNSSNSASPSSSRHKGQSDSTSSAVVCWNCQGLNHTFQNCRVKRKLFCYRCGHPDVKVFNCPVCKKN